MHDRVELKCSLLSQGFTNLRPERSNNAICIQIRVHTQTELAPMSRLLIASQITICMNYRDKKKLTVLSEKWKNLNNDNDNNNNKNNKNGNDNGNGNDICDCLVQKAYSRFNRDFREFFSVNDLAAILCSPSSPD